MNTSSSRRILPALAVTLVAAGCQSSEGEAAPPDSADVRVVNVEVQAVTPEPFEDYIRITGEVEALYDVTVSAEETGRVTGFAARKGSRVQEGAVVVQLDDEVLRAQRDEARAQAGLAREQFERQRRLWEDEGIGSEIAFLQARSAAEAAAARLQTLETRLARTKIRAPVTGVFDQKFIEVGELASPGMPLVRVVSTGRVKIAGGIPERYALAVRRGDTARVALDVLPGRDFAGEIRYVGTSVDPANRTVPIEVVMANPNGVVRPRMIANLQVRRARLDSVLVVPQQIVKRVEDGYQVFVLAERDGHPVAEARTVTLGPAYRNRVVVTSGLEAGDTVITVGSLLVDHGSRVRIVPHRAGEGA